MEVLAVIPAGAVGMTAGGVSQSSSQAVNDIAVTMAAAVYNNALSFILGVYY
jgi:hypothetical protein